MIVSFALNRIYTEWYRAKGYDFDITNSTSFDQSFVNGREIFGNVSRIADQVEVFLSHNEKGQRVFLGEEDVSEEIRREEISQMASIVSAVPFVREKLLSLQRDMAQCQSVVMDGRDIGTRILPNAEYKVFLVCPAEERARRRLLQLREQGLSGDYDQILADIKERDHRDMTREISPLVKADDAIEFDTTGHTAESSANELIEVLGLCPKSC